MIMRSPPPHHYVAPDWSKDTTEKSSPHMHHNCLHYTSNLLAGPDARI